MGSRPSSFKRSGGGFLNGVDAVIADYAFVVGDTVEIKKGRRKGEDFTPLSLEVSFQQDGADEPVSMRLLVGDAGFFGDVSDDGKTLDTPEGQNLMTDSEAGVFISSLCEGGFPESNFSDDPDAITFEPMIGTRVHLKNEVDEEKTKRQGKQKNKKTGVEYDRRTLRVATVHALPEEQGSKSPKGKASASKSSSKAKGKAAKDEDEDDVAAIAAETLREILGDTKDGTIAKSKLSMAILKKLTKDPNREAVREYLNDDDNLENEIEGVSYNKKKQLISLDE